MAKCVNLVKIPVFHDATETGSDEIKTSSIGVYTNANSNTPPDFDMENTPNSIPDPVTADSNNTAVKAKPRKEGSKRKSSRPRKRTSPSTMDNSPKKRGRPRKAQNPLPKIVIKLDADPESEQGKTCGICGKFAPKQAKKCHNCHNFFYEYTTPISIDKALQPISCDLAVSEASTSCETPPGMRTPFEQVPSNETNAENTELIPTVLSIIKMCGNIGSPSDSVRSKLNSEDLKTNEAFNSYSNNSEAPLEPEPSEASPVKPTTVEPLNQTMQNPIEEQSAMNDRTHSVPQDSDNKNVTTPQADQGDNSGLHAYNTGACNAQPASVPSSGLLNQTSSLTTDSNSLMTPPAFADSLLQSTDSTPIVSQAANPGPLADLLPYVQSPLVNSVGNSLPVYSNSYIPLRPNFPPTSTLSAPLSSQIKDFIEKLRQPPLTTPIAPQQRNPAVSQDHNQRKRSPPQEVGPPIKKSKDTTTSLTAIVSGIIQNIGKALQPIGKKSEVQLQPKPMVPEMIPSPLITTQARITSNSTEIDGPRASDNSADSALTQSNSLLPAKSCSSEAPDSYPRVIPQGPTAAIGNVVVRNINPETALSTKSSTPVTSSSMGTAGKANYQVKKSVISPAAPSIIPRNGGVYVSVLGRSVSTISPAESPALGMAGPPTTVPVDPESGSKKSSDTTNGNKDDGKSSKKKGSNKKRSRNGSQQGNGGEEDNHKKRRSNSTNSAKKESKKRRLKSYSVRLRDCYFHHVPWSQTRVVLIVPSLPDGEPLSSVPDGTRDNLEASPNGKASGEGIAAAGKSSKTKKQKKDVPAGSMSACVIKSACFSVHDIHNKLVPSLSLDTLLRHSAQNRQSNCPQHWLQVLDRMGAITESNGKCTLIDCSTAVAILSRYKPSAIPPDSLEKLCQNKIPKRRKVINFSDVLPEDFLKKSEYLAQIPFPTELATTSVAAEPVQKSPDKEVSSQPAAQSQETAQESHDTTGMSHESNATIMEINHAAQKSFDTEGVTSQESVETAQASHNDLMISHDESQTIPADTQAGSEANSVSCFDESSVESNEDNAGRDGLGDIFPSLKLGRKEKYCPECGAVLSKRCRKCIECGKQFGVFTFGRKLCPSCGRCNRAKMTACFGCGHRLIELSPSKPKDAVQTATEEVLPAPVEAAAACSRKRPHPGDQAEDSEPEPANKAKKEKHFSVSSSGPSSRLPSTAESDVTLEEPSGSTTPTPGKEPPVKLKPNLSKFSLYKYGRVPWGEADVTCLIDEKGVPSFCLPELCSKVLRDHPKNDVIDIVRDLDLPLLEGDMMLLKKLQSLGLHSSRSPVCRLIGTEEVWTLLDALQERVPVEVHQHMENIAESARPLLSTAASNTPPSPVIVRPPMEDDDPRLKPTLHWIKCSDGQSIAMLRMVNGEEFGSLTEIWRRYFPEVNRNHLTSVLNKLNIETTIPTGSQGSVLRSGNVISLRGHAGRLIKFELMQVLIDSLSIPLQIGQDTSNKDKTEKIALPSPTIGNPPSLKQLPGASRPKKFNHPPLTQASLIAGAAAQGKVLATAEDVRYAEVMRGMLQVVELSDIKQLLVTAHRRAAEKRGSVDSSSTIASLDNIHQRISSHRELCSVLNDEIGYLNMTNHGVMAEVVRTGQREKIILNEIDKLFKSYNLQLK